MGDSVALQTYPLFYNVGLVLQLGFRLHNRRVRLGLKQCGFRSQVSQKRRDLGHPRLIARLRALSLNELGKHALGIDGDKKAAAASQHLAFDVYDFGHVDMSPSSDAHLPRIDP
jgi:hypothetical protein